LHTFSASFRNDTSKFKRRFYPFPQQVCREDYLPGLGIRIFEEAERKLRRFAGIHMRVPVFFNRSKVRYATILAKSGIGAICRSVGLSRWMAVRSFLSEYHFLPDIPVEAISQSK